MNTKELESLGDHSMLDLFRMEIENQTGILTQGLISLEEESNPAKIMEELMRAAHSAKGAARIVNRSPGVRVAHSMEDCFVEAQKGATTIPQAKVDVLLRGVDLLARISMVPDESFAQWELEHQAEIDEFVASLAQASQAGNAGSESSLPPSPSATSLEQTAGLSEADPSGTSAAGRPESSATSQQAGQQTADRVLRVGAENLNRLLGLAGEALVASRWLDSFAARLLRLKRIERNLGHAVENLRGSLGTAILNERSAVRLTELQDRATTSQRFIADTIAELEQFDRRFVNLSTRLYEEVLNSRMRPFAEGTQGFPRLVRDVARSLGKKAKLLIEGSTTTVDRDILERLKAPLDHLLRNSVDHGLETPNERGLAGKPEEGVVELEARHSAGALLVTVADDGRGIDLESVRAKVIEKKLVSADAAQRMSEAELLEFLFLPGFTMRQVVTEVSGRGVGLDVVQTAVREVGGRVRISSRPGKGTRFQLELPLTLSVIRAMLVDIGGEPYAFPLARIAKAVRLPKDKIESVEGKQHFTQGDQPIGLVAAHQALELSESQTLSDELSVVVLEEKSSSYGLVVDQFIGESELVVRPLDPRLGKVRNVSAAALMPDGTPVLIVDVEDLVRSIENLISGQRLSQLRAGASGTAERKQKRILVVDDSLTVRELERKLLSGRGYQVDIAVDGMDGWNAVRTGHYDLILTDIDMPRLDGIELLRMIRKDARLKPLPVAVVSYKDREEDRQRGLEAGADYYLTKGSFQDETLIRAVADLIGRAGD